MIVDLFAGMGGWDHADPMMADAVGFEIDRDACATRAATGLRTIRADIATWPLGPLAGKVTGLVASPPCQTFSTAGKGDGVEHLDALCALARNYRPDAHDRIDGRTELVLEPLRWALALRPRWVAAEQVPAVLPIWHAIADTLRAHGYSTWAGVLNAADYGVPQTRRRAILIASLDRTVGPPAPTHAQHPAPSLFGDEPAPWVSMADALGWADGRVGFARLDDRGDSPDGYRERDWRTTDEPAFAMTEKARSWVLRERQKHGATRRLDQPAMTIPAAADNGNYRWVLDWRQSHGGIHPIAGPSPALSTLAGGQWVVRPEQSAPLVLDQRQTGAMPVPVTRPSPTVVGTALGKGVSQVRERRATEWAYGRSATTVVSSFRPDVIAAPGYRTDTPRQDRPGSIAITVADALVLQSFDPTLPVQGTRTAQFRQVGNAVPPRLAAHIVAAATGTEVAP